MLPCMSEFFGWVSMINVRSLRSVCNNVAAPLCLPRGREFRGLTLFLETTDTPRINEGPAQVELCKNRIMRKWNYAKVELCASGIMYKWDYAHVKVELCAIGIMQKSNHAQVELCKSGIMRN